MKYTSSPWEMQRSDYEDILRKVDVLINETGTKKSVHKVLVSANGVKRNEYSDEMQNIVVLEDLFAD